MKHKRAEKKAAARLEQETLEAANFTKEKDKRVAEEMFGSSGGVRLSYKKTKKNMIILLIGDFASTFLSLQHISLSLIHLLEKKKSGKKIIGKKIFRNYHL